MTYTYFSPANVSKCATIYGSKQIDYHVGHQMVSRFCIRGEPEKPIVR